MANAGKTDAGKTKAGNQGTDGQKTGGTGEGPETTEFLTRMADVSARAQDMMVKFWKEAPAKIGAPGGPADLVRSASNFWESIARTWAAADPKQLVDLQQKWMTDAVSLWTGFLTGKPAENEVKDRRFRGEEWAEVPVFDLIRRSYLLASDYLTRSLDAFPGLEEEDRERLRFQAQQFVDAMSPSNFASLNPEVLAEARKTNGQSLLTGLGHMLDDLKRGKMTMTDESAFEVGRNVAVTPGKVVFENRLFQLIQYAPLTKEVHEIPVLFFPAWINKFYILDLTAEKSLVRWLSEQGFTVFMVSWKNPDETLRDITMDSYVIEGMETAIETVRKITGVDAVHTVGYCVAGTTLAAALSYYTAKKKVSFVKSATFFTAQVDFSEAGDLLNYVQPGMLDTLKKLGEERGYVDGRWLALSFNMLRPNDLMWNYVVNNYLKGQPYKPFDLLYWNSDSTNVPAGWHQKYLHDLYQNNLLVQPGAISIDGVPIDLGNVKTPVYIQAGREDHIAPPMSCFKMTRTFSGEYRFILAGSGHIAGVINPPALNKYCYWTLPKGRKMPDTYEGFTAIADEHPGSWWGDWAEWLAKRSGKMIPARTPGETKAFPAIEDAPGRYVKEKVGPDAAAAA